MQELLNEIKNFRNWSNTVNQKSGEWETDYLNWDKINSFCKQLIQSTPVEQWNSEMLHEFLYILARDNECENILKMLIDHPKQLIMIAEHVVTYPDWDARWQIAHGLGEIHENGQTIKELLEMFLSDENEYVRRRASLAYERKGF